tara:strand:- start:1054 stop:1335 length:282 start_codon:yes stop_codon:yes gene_type:complete
LSQKKLIKQLKEKNHKLNQSELKDILDVFNKNISKNLKEQKIIEIRGFGRWYYKKLKENFNARNPATNELIYKPERVKIRFRASKKLKKIINE